jgi:hypothetical protein
MIIFLGDIRPEGDVEMCKAEAERVQHYLNDSYEVRELLSCLQRLLITVPNVHCRAVCQLPGKSGCWEKLGWWSTGRYFKPLYKSILHPENLYLAMNLLGLRLGGHALILMRLMNDRKSSAPVLEK